MLKMITILGMLVLIAVIGSVYTQPQSSSNSKSDEVAAVKTACLDYVEGWFDSSTERVERSVHPDLVKRIPKDNALNEMTRDVLIKSTKMKKKSRPEIVVEVYDVFKDIALAKVTSGFVDYVQLAKIEGRWQVVNVLWQQF
jgi:hypothetical protein